jgi:uncharacterized protein YjiS (DUF1127 family)
MNVIDVAVARVGRAIFSRLRARVAARTLHRFDDRLLADIGVSRSEIDALVRGTTRRRG